MLESRTLALRLGVSLLGLAAFGQVGAAAPQVHPIDLDSSYSAESYTFLDAAIGSRTAVALGESIHVTQEMPLVR